MIDKLTADQPIGTALSPGGATSRVHVDIRKASPGPTLQPGVDGDRARVRLLGTLTLTGKKSPVGIQKIAPNAAPLGVDSDARHSNPAYQRLQRLIDRVNSEEPGAPSPEEARKLATALIGSDSCTWEDALSFMKMLRAQNITPHVINYGALMGRAKSEFPQELGSIKVLAIYDDMCKDQVRPNLLVYTTVMTAMGRQGRPRDAEKLFREMEARGEEADPKAFNALMSAYAAQGGDHAVNEVMRLYQELIQRGHGAPQYMLDRALNLARADRQAPLARSLL